MRTLQALFLFKMRYFDVKFVFVFVLKFFYFRPVRTPQVLFYFLKCVLLVNFVLFFNFVFSFEASAYTAGFFVFP